MVKPTNFLDFGLPVVTDPQAIERQLGGALRGLGDDYVRAGLSHGVNPLLLAAISMHETGNGTSRAANSGNNVMGISNSSGVRNLPPGGREWSINRMAELLASGNAYARARATNSIDTLASIYAPVGAGNDPRNLNQHWPNGIRKYAGQIAGHTINTNASSIQNAVYMPGTNGVGSSFLMNIGMQYDNLGYQMGGRTLNGRSIDCSGFVSSILRKYFDMNNFECTAENLADVLAGKMGTQAVTLGNSNFTLENIPPHSVISFRKNKGYPFHVVFTTTDENGKQWAIHSTSSGPGGRGVQTEPLEGFLRRYRGRLNWAKVTDISSKVLEEYNGNYALMSSQLQERENPWLYADEATKLADLHNSIQATQNIALQWVNEKTIILNNKQFNISFDNTNMSNQSEIERNGNIINISVANMTNNWSRYSAITHMAKEAGIDAGMMQKEIARQMMLRTPPDRSYYEFLQRLPPEYGFGSLKGKSSETFINEMAQQDAIRAQKMMAQQQAQMQVQQEMPPAPPVTQAQPHGFAADRDAALRQAGQNGQNVNFTAGGQEAAQGRIAHDDLNKLLREAHQEFAQENPVLARYYQNRILMVEGTPLSRNALNGNGGSVEVIGVQPGMNKDDVKEMLAGRAAMAQAMQAQNADIHANVTQIRPLTPA